MITFGAGYGAGNLAGLALVGKELTETTIKTIGTIAGAIAGSGVRTGSYYVITKLDGKPVEVLQLILEGISGAISGGFAGYLGAKVGIKYSLDKFAADNKNIEKSLQDALNQFTDSEIQELNQHIQIVCDKQTVIEVIPDIDGSRVAIIEGWHNADHQGAGIIHILKQREDLIQKLFGFTSQETQAALNGNQEVLQKIGHKFGDLLNKPPYGIVGGQRGCISYVWEYNGQMVKVGISSNNWSHGCKTLIQANPVSRNEVLPISVFKKTKFL